MTATPDSPFPPEGTGRYRLLAALLNGERISPVSAIVDLNIPIVAARVSELRKLGWPVRVMETPHPNREKFPGETLPVYFLDAHFRAWTLQDGKGKHPRDYPDSEGRGKFVRNKATDT